MLDHVCVVCSATLHFFGGVCGKPTFSLAMIRQGGACRKRTTHFWWSGAPWVPRTSGISALIHKSTQYGGKPALPVISKTGGAREVCWQQQLLYVLLSKHTQHRRKSPPRRVLLQSRIDPDHLFPKPERILRVAGWGGWLNLSSCQQKTNRKTNKEKKTLTLVEVRYSSLLAHGGEEGLKRLGVSYPPSPTLSPGFGGENGCRRAPISRYRAPLELPR